QAQTAIVVGIVILTAGSAAVALGGRTSGRTLSDTPQKWEFPFSWPAADKDAWEVAPLDQQWLHKAPAQVVVRPTKFPNFLGGAHGEDDQGIGIAMDAQYLILAAYQLNKQHVEFAAILPGGKYDYIANLPSGSGKALQQEIKKQLGLTGHFEPRTKDVFVLRVRDTNSLKFTPRNSGDQAGM